MKRILLAAAAALGATPALAHHPLAGEPMTTFAHGLLSGVGHPVLGFDHLFFVAAMGVAALWTGQRLLAPLAYVAAMMAGVALVYAGGALPLVEPVIVLSLLVLGAVAMSGRALGLTPAVVLFAGFGLFHGAAFGEPIGGVEAAAGGAVLTGYLLSLAVTQYAIALGAGLIAARVLGASSAASVNARMAGAAVAGVGVFLALELIEGPVVALLTAA